MGKLRDMFLYLRGRPRTGRPTADLMYMVQLPLERQLLYAPKRCQAFVDACDQDGEKGVVATCYMPNVEFGNIDSYREFTKRDIGTLAAYRLSCDHGAGFESLQAVHEDMMQLTASFCGMTWPPSQQVSLE